MNQNADRDYQNFIEAFEVSSFLPFFRNFRNYDAIAKLLYV